MSLQLYTLLCLGWSYLVARHGSPQLKREVLSQVAAGATVEYSAHVILEGGLAAMPKLAGAGVLVAGDAAGLALNLGITVRGIDLALISGLIAARAILQARGAGGLDMAPGRYDAALRDTVILKDLHTFRNVMRTLDNPLLFTRYPALVCQVLQDLMAVGEGAKPGLAATALRTAWQGAGGLSAVGDVLSLLSLEAAMNIESKLGLDVLALDKEPHKVVNQAVCRERCRRRVCLTVCPARLCTQAEDGCIVLNWEGYLECGTCKLACVQGALEWRYPQGGFGVQYRFG
jgi:ferredoxin-like protein FixX